MEVRGLRREGVELLWSESVVGVLRVLVDALFSPSFPPVEETPGLGVLPG